MSADPETLICRAAGRIVAGALPEVEGRILHSRAIPQDARYWPCALVFSAATRVDTSPGNPGRRMQTKACMLSVLLVGDGAPEDCEERLRALGVKAEAALMADTHLREGGPKPLATNLVLASLATDVLEKRGAVIAARRLDFIATYHTHETNPAEAWSR